MGGKLYTTTRTTLENCGENMLSNLVSDKYSPMMIEDAYFIDRNGELFGDILDFLRNIQEYKVPTNSDKVNALLTEAKYYAIVPLIERLEGKIKHLMNAFWVDLPIYGQDANFEFHECSSGTPEDIQTIISECLVKKIYTETISIILMARQHGYYLIQSIPINPTRGDYVTCVRLIFQGY